MTATSLPVAADLTVAAKHATQHPRDKGAPPHWLRCLTVIEDRRCILGEGHMGEHVFPKEAP